MKPLPKPEKILVRATNWVGDAIMMTPALRALRNTYPKAHITVLAKPWVMPIFEHSDSLDALMRYQSTGRHKGPFGVFRLAADIAAGNFDTAFLFQNAFEAALLVWMARIPTRIGFSTDGRGLLLSHPITTWRTLKKGHFIDYCLGVVKGVGLQPYGRHLSLTLRPEELTQAYERLHELAIPPDQPIIGLNPGAAYGTAKRWPIDRFVALGRHLAHAYGATLLVFGAANEAAIGRELCEGIGPASHNLVGRTSLRQAMALIGHCALFVTNDSGLMHIAAALEIPQVVLIGPTDPIATGPVNAASKTVQAMGVCAKSPCLLPHCPLDHRCMTAISEEEVFQAASSLLQSRSLT